MSLLYFIAEHPWVSLFTLMGFVWAFESCVEAIRGTKK